MESWFTENILLICLASGTFVVALLTFLSSTTDWFKRTIPIQFGFLVDNEILEKLELSTGDPAKPIFFRFHNSRKSTLTGLVFDIRFHRPIGLSGTGQALTYIAGKTTHGLIPDNSYYLYRHSELVMAGEENMDFRVELNTQNKPPGTYKVTVTVYSTQKDYKYKKVELLISMK